MSATAVASHHVPLDLIDVAENVRELDQAHVEALASEIALRRGRVKRDARGNISGETSWLARHIGQMPEGGEDRPCPWIHTDVLARIARDGLCISPHEVEL
jgi:hypothetical protein